MGGDNSVINGSYGGLFPVYQLAIQSDGKIVANGGGLSTLREKSIAAWFA